MRVAGMEGIEGMEGIAWMSVDSIGEGGRRAIGGGV